MECPFKAHNKYITIIINQQYHYHNLLSKAFCTEEIGNIGYLKEELIDL